jgi:hypothetical protein
MTGRKALGIGGLLLLALLAMGQMFGPALVAATTCTNQFIRSLALGGAGTCATVGSSDLASSLSLTTPNIGAATATSINFGGSTLANYVEGTWTPTFVGSGTAGTGQTYSLQIGSYERVGRQVTARFILTASSLGTAAGNLILAGLPLTSVSGDNGQCFIGNYTVAGLGTLSYGLSGFIAQSTTQALLYQNTNTGSTALTVTQAGATVAIQGTCIYRAT